MRSIIIVFSAIISTIAGRTDHAYQQLSNVKDNGAIHFPTEDLYNTVRQSAFGQRPLKQTNQVSNADVQFPSRQAPPTMQTVYIPNPSMQSFQPMNSVQSHNNGFQTSAATPSSIQQNSDIIDFTWEIFQGSRTSNPIQNLVLSPLLLQIVLSLLHTAADGRTQEQFAKVTHNVSPQHLNQLVRSIYQTQSRNQIGLAAAVFTDKQIPLNQTFINEASARHVGMIPVNFGNDVESAYTVNSWISNATANHILNIFKPENARGIQVLLANAMYFRGFWRQVFESTERGLFYSTEPAKIVTYMKKVEMMRSSEFECESGARGIWAEIPYEGNEFSMIVILPAKRNSLEAFIRQMSSKDIKDIMDQLSYGYRRLVHLKMPKFEVQSSFSLVNVLLKLGLVDLFTLNSRLPFLTDNHERLKIDDILQQAVLSVDETGTVAAVAQTVNVVTLSLVDTPDEVAITLDQPFVLMIVDRRNAIPLFMAKIFDP